MADDRAPTKKGKSPCAVSPPCCCSPPRFPPLRKRATAGHSGPADRSKNSRSTSSARRWRRARRARRSRGRISRGSRRWTARARRLRAVIAVNPDAMAAGAGERRAAQGEEAARPARRRADPDQGQYRDQGPDRDHRGQPRAQGQCHAPRRAGGGAAARAGRGDPGQDQPQRMGQYPVDQVDERVERGRRAGAQSRTRSTAPRADRRAAPARGSRRASRRRGWGPRPTGRWCARRR